MSQCGVVHCIALQCTAVFGRSRCAAVWSCVLQSFAASGGLQCNVLCCSILQFLAVPDVLLPCVAVCCSSCSGLQLVAMCCSSRCVAVCCCSVLMLRRRCRYRCPNGLQTSKITATHCNTLQHTATHCNTPDIDARMGLRLRGSGC